MLKINQILKFFISVLIGFTLTLALCVPAASASALSGTSNQMLIDFIRSADCTGELVEISGTIHLINQTQADGSVIGHFNYQNVTGVGLTSGITYQTTAVDHMRLSAPFPSSITSVQSFQLIGRGSESNLLVQMLYHITVNENGEVTVSIDDLNMQCT